MEDKLRLNTSFFGFDGIIGRRDYFLNMVYIWGLSAILTIPYTGWLFGNIETLADLCEPYKMFLSAPILLKLWHIVVLLAIAAVAISNNFRRMNDILGEVNNNINLLCALLWVLSSLGLIFLPIGMTGLYILNLVLLCVFLFKEGKITSKYPYDFRKEFNWGAFLGTWMWGLYNKSYATLATFILWCTPIGFYFKLYCGLKGNEWAYKNKNYSDVETFNKSQEKQTIFFVILNFVLIPIIWTALIIGLTFGIMAFAKNTPCNTTNPAQPSEAKIESIADTISSSFFEKHEITADSNKYYVLESDWKDYGYREKVKILDMAAQMAASEKRKTYRKAHPNESCCSRFSKSTELDKTKIYGSNTGKLLGEYVMDDKEFENASFKEAMKAVFKAYRFYNP